MLSFYLKYCIFLQSGIPVRTFPALLPIPFLVPILANCTWYPGIGLSLYPSRFFLL